MVMYHLGWSRRKWTSKMQRNMRIRCYRKQNGDFLYLLKLHSNTQCALTIWITWRKCQNLYHWISLSLGWTMSFQLNVLSSIFMMGMAGKAEHVSEFCQNDWSERKCSCGADRKKILQDMFSATAYLERFVYGSTGDRVTIILFLFFD